MIDQALNAGSTFDWISPVLASAQDIGNGPSHTFLIPDQCGWSGFAIRDLLHRSGVQTWGLMIVSDTLMVSVPKDSSSWAFTVLSRNGIPVENPPATSNALPKRDHAPEISTPPTDQRSTGQRQSEHRHDAVSWIERLADVLHSVMRHFPIYSQFQDVINED